MKLIVLDGWHVREPLWEHDLAIAEEVLLRDCYRLAELPAPTTVVDIGGYIGAFARACLRWPQAQVIVVEADARNLPAIRANAPAAELFHAAATYQREVAVCSSIFAGSQAPSNSSVFPLSSVANYRGDNWQPVAERLPTITLETLCAMSGGRIDLLKLDCEGSEFNLLEHAADATLANIGTIVGEFHGDPAGGHGLPGWQRLVARRLPGRRLETWGVNASQHQGLFRIPSARSAA